MRATAVAWVTWLALGGCSQSTVTAPDAEAMQDVQDVMDAAPAQEDVKPTHIDSMTSQQEVFEAADADVPRGPLVYAGCPIAERIGGFQITLAEEYTAVSGLVSDGVVPANVPEEVQSEGDCRLLRARSLYCDPTCVPGETCGEQGDCIPYPETVSVGTVVVEGLEEPLSMEAKWGNNYTNPGSMVHPGYASGAELALTADGGAFEAFALRGLGVEALVVPDTTSVVTSGEPLTLSWTPPTVDGPVKVHIELNVNNHGSTSAWIVCDVEDTGTYAVPASLIDALQTIGVSGFPSLSLVRRSADSATIGPGCVEFLVRSGLDLSVEVDGIKSCTSDQQCPPGQSCGVDLACH